MIAEPRAWSCDYGSGNLRSAERALARAGADVVVTTDPSVAADADGLVVPGVGAFAACMAGIGAVGGDKLIAERVRPAVRCSGSASACRCLRYGDEHGVPRRGCGQCRAR